MIWRPRACALPAALTIFWRTSQHGGSVLRDEAVLKCHQTLPWISHRRPAVARWRALWWQQVHRVRYTAYCAHALACECISLLLQIEGLRQSWAFQRVKLPKLDGTSHIAIGSRNVKRILSNVSSGSSEMTDKFRIEALDYD